MKNLEFLEILGQDCDWTAFRNKSFLISGATGLIGKALVDLLCYLSENLNLSIRLILISRNIREEDYKKDYIRVIRHDVNIPLDDINLPSVDFVILQSGSIRKAYRN